MVIAMLMAAALGQASAGQMPRHQGMDRQARFDRFFAMADTNHDGQLSRAELQAARERMREHRMERRANGWQGRQGWRQGQGWQQGQRQGAPRR